MRLDEAIAALEPREIASGGGPVELADLAYDARQVSPGALFFCVAGAKVDGHDFAPEAVERGAVALVVERALDVGVPQLVVPDSRAAMAVVADAFFGFPTRDLTVAAVTGTNGKTTTAHLMFSILAAAGKRPGLLGNIERRVGNERRPAVLNTPEAIDLQRLFREMLDSGNESVAMEASSHASALHRLDRTRFAVLVFTNLTQDHLDFHGSMDEYFEAKRRLFAQADAAAVNLGDEYGRRLAGELPDALTFGVTGSAAIGPESLDGVDLKLRGGFNVENALGALAAGRLLGFDDQTIHRGIEALEVVPGRFEPVEAGQPFRVIVDFAHTPDSLDRVLRAARELTDGRVICVFGAGGDRDRTKRPKMGRAVADGADVVVVTSDNPRTEDPIAIIEDIVEGTGPGAEIEPDRALAIERALRLAQEGDIVVIAGLSPEQGRHIGGESFPWDDREVAREALRRIGAAA